MGVAAGFTAHVVAEPLRVWGSEAAPGLPLHLRLWMCG